MDVRPWEGVGAKVLGSRNVDCLLTDDKPISARLVPEEERPNKGWLGRDMARDCLDPDMDRTWLLEKGALPAAVLDRFMADAGWGRLELELRFPRVCARRQSG